MNFVRYKKTTDEEQQGEVMILLDNYNEVLKQKFLNTGFIKESDLYRYTLRNQKNNFFEEMSDKTIMEYSNGDGKELTDGKIRQVRSSSAMIYNILGNGDVEISANEILPPGLYKKEFEKKYKTIDVINKKTGKQVEANLDAWLHNDSAEIFIESKCLEWLENKCERELRKSYLYTTKKYFYQRTAELFKKAGHEIPLSQYDSCQMFKHTLAIYNYLKDSNITGKKILLLNVVWEPEADELSIDIRESYRVQLSLEHAEFNYFYKLMKPVINAIKDDTHNDFDIIYLPVKDFCSIINYKNEKQKRFVQRYL